MDFKIWTYFHFITIASFSFSHAQNANGTSADFGKTFVGVAFSPYVKNWVFTNETFDLPQWNTYSFEEIKVMLKLISTKFNHVSTYSMGVEWHNVDKAWDKTDANCLVGKVAAELNAERNNLSISIAQGIHQNAYPNVLPKEIENAFAAVAYANGKYPQTIWGLTFLNEAIDREKGTKLLGILKEHKGRAHGQGIKIGTRLQNCAEVLGGNDSSTKEILLKISQEVDFIMCSEFPNAQAVNQGPKAAAQIIINNIKEYTKVFKGVNKDVEIILGETGWPSMGRGYNGPAEGNTISNLQTYWTEISELSQKNEIRTYLFEAFDEPWKSNHKITDPNQPDGRYGAEGHFGWWRRTNNSDINAYVEKIYEPQPLTDEPDGDDRGNNTKIVSSGTGGGGATIGIVVASFFLFTLVPIVIVLFCRLRKAQTLIGRLTETEIEEFEKGFDYHELDSEGGDYQALYQPYNRDFEIPKSKMSIDKEKLLGKGEFGYVYKGTVEGVSEEAAFKTTKSGNSTQQLKCILAELKIMIYIGKHENVIRLLGAYTGGIREGIVYIVAEFCALGSLEKHLRSYSCYGVQGTSDERPSYTNIPESHYTYAVELVDQISMAQLIKWSQEIANGMEWLATKKVIHADLATRNVLLTADKIVKITDFGLSRRLYDYTNYVKESQEPLPWRYMAIESLRTMNFSTMSDVWSYGITLWELFSMGDVPYAGLSWHADFVEELERGLRLSCPKYATQQIFQIMVKCWEKDPKDRPTFPELNNFFKEMTEAQNTQNSIL